MSESTPMPREFAEFLIAIGPERGYLVMGARGAIARDLVGDLEPTLRWLPGWLKASVGLAPAGLHVWEGTIEGLPRSEMPMAYRGEGGLRPAVLADLERFGLEPLLPRIPEKTIPR